MYGFPEMDHDLSFMPYWYQFNLNGSQSFHNDMWVPNAPNPNAFPFSPSLFPPFFPNPTQLQTQQPTQPQPQPTQQTQPTQPMDVEEPQPEEEEEKEEHVAPPPKKVTRKRRQSQQTQPKKAKKKTQPKRVVMPPMRRRVSAPQPLTQHQIESSEQYQRSKNQQYHPSSASSANRRVSDGHGARPMPTYMNNSLLQSLHRIHVESTNPANQNIRPQHQKKNKNLIKKNGKQSKKKVKNAKHKKKVKSSANHSNNSNGNSNSNNGKNKESNKESLSMSSELMEFFYNSQIRKNRKRVEKKNRENAVIESAMTTKQKYECHLREMKDTYGEDNAQKIGQCEMAMDANFSQALDAINSNQPTHKQVAFWPEAPLQF